MLIKELMHAHPVTVQKDMPIRTALDLLEKLAVRHLPVLDGTRLVGMVSDRDLVPVLYDEDIDPDHAVVGQVMTPEPITVESSASARDAIDLIAEHRIGALPVIQDGRVLVGIVSFVDLLRVIAEQGPERTVSEIMSREVTGIDVRAGAWVALEALRELRIRHLPVVEGGALVGVLSDRDLAPLAGRRRAGRQTPALSQLMNSDVISVSPEVDVSEAIELMLEFRLGSLPVTSADSLELVGMVTYIDILCSHADLVA